MAAINFNAAEVAPQTAFDPLPPGNYVAVITESEEKATKAGTGSYLQLTFEVVEGQYQGRKVWARLNLNNPNDQAVAIARAELSAICHAVNVIDLKDTTQLHDLPMAIRLCGVTAVPAGCVIFHVATARSWPATTASAPLTGASRPTVVVVAQLSV
jgi:hypothetical protein